MHFILFHLRNTKYQQGFREKKMPPKRSAKVVVTKKVVQETVQVSILEAKKKAKDPGEDNEQPQLKSISIEDKGGGGGGEKSETVRIAVQEKPEQREPSTSLEQEEWQQRKQKKEEKDQLGNEKSKGKKRKRRSGGGSEEYKTYVFKVLKQVHPGMAISSKATTVVNNYMADMFERIADEAATLSKYNKRMTLSSREILGAVKVVLPGDLGKHAIAEGNKAVTNYLSHNVNDSKS